MLDFTIEVDFYCILLNQHFFHWSQ